MLAGDLLAVLEEELAEARALAAEADSAETRSDPANVTQTMTGRASEPKDASGTAPAGTRFTGQAPETLPGAKDALDLLDEVAEATWRAAPPGTDAPWRRT